MMIETRQSLSSITRHSSWPLSGIITAPWISITSPSVSVSRSSHTAIERDRVSARSRYHRTRDHARKVQKAYKEERYENRPFIGWDSEGYDYFICHADGTVGKGP